MVSFSYVNPLSEGKAHENGGTTKDSPERQDEIIHQDQQNHGPDLVHHSSKHHLATLWSFQFSSGIGEVSRPDPEVENHRIHAGCS